MSSSPYPPLSASELAAFTAEARRLDDEDPQSFGFQMMALEGATQGQVPVYVPLGDVLKKNRYLDMLPSAEHRVRLGAAVAAAGGGPDADYINACWLRGLPCAGPARRYIAAQAPIEEMFAAWWGMVWEQDVRVVLMLTGLVEKGTLKANQYWPGLRRTEQYGRFQVTLNDRRAFENETVRTFSVACDGVVRTVTHIQYTTWPDHGVPANPDAVVRFLEIYRRERDRHPDSPVLLHCSAGVGRTGTFAAIDVALDTLGAGQPVSVFDLVMAIRRCRPGAVQTVAQYAFIFEVLAHAYRNGRLGLGAAA